MSLRYSSWKECLLAKTVSIEGTTGNDNMGAFPAATNKTTTPSAALLANLTEDGSVLLTVLENGEEKKLSIIHQVKNFGGTRTRNSNKVVALKGLAADAKILICWNVKARMMLRAALQSIRQSIARPLFVDWLFVARVLVLQGIVGILFSVFIVIDRMLPLL